MTFDLIIPVYNTDPILFKRCLDSVFSQTNKNYICTIVNDCSTNANTIKFLNEIKENYSQFADKINIISHKTNKKLCAARNTGYDYSSNELVWFLDSDDQINSDEALNIIEKNFIKYEDLDILSFTVKWGSGTKKTNEKIACTSEPVSLENCPTVLVDKPTVPGKVFKRNFLSDNKIRHYDGWYFAEDVYFLGVTYARAKKIMVITDKLYQYNINNEGSITATNNWIKKINGLFENVKLVYETIKDDNSFSGNNFSFLLNILFYARIKFIITDKEILRSREYKYVIFLANNFRKKVIAEGEQRMQNTVHSIPIVYSTDENGIDLLKVSMFSLLSNAHINTRYEIFITHDEIREESKNILLDICSLFENHKIKFIDCKKYEEKYAIVRSHSKGSYDNIKSCPATSYYHLLIPEILSNVEKLIYLHIDTLILHDLTALFYQNIRKTFGAVNSVINPNINIFHKVPNREKYLQYNNGVILINNTMWKKFYEPSLYFNEIRKFNFFDEDLTNYEFINDVNKLNFKYNVQLHHFIETKIFASANIMRMTTEEKNNILGYANILHFTCWDVIVKPSNVFNDSVYERVLEVGIEKFLAEQKTNKIIKLFSSTPSSFIYWRAFKLWGEYWLKTKQKKVGFSAKKRITILTETPHNTMGGAQTYNKKIMDIMENNFDVEVKEFVLYKAETIEIEKATHDVVLTNQICINDELLKYKPDLVISSANAFVSPSWDCESIYIQHSNNEILKRLHGMASMEGSLVSEWDNARICNNSVCFTPQDAKVFKEYFPHYENIWSILLTSSNLGNTNSQRDNIITYVGRLDENKFSFILQLANFLPFKIHVWGKGNAEYIKQARMNKNIDYHGLASKDQLKEIYNATKFVILGSIKEGFGFVLMEAFSCGTPIIVTKCSSSIDFLVNNGENGFLINDMSNPEEQSKKITNFINSCDYDTMSKNCLKFYEENLTEKLFEEHWKEVLKHFGFKSLK